MSLLYCFFTGLIAAAGLLMLLTPHVLYTILGLLGVMLGIAAIYFLQGAAFLAVTQVLVYGSGVLVLLLFSSLLLSLDTRSTPTRRWWMLVGPVVVLLGGFLQIWVLEVEKLLPTQTPVAVLSNDVVAMMGLQLVGPYALAFEWAGLILLIALVGSLYLLKPHK